MDEALEFGLPGLTQRRSLLALYLDKYIRAAGTEQVGVREGTWQRGRTGGKSGVDVFD
jgi:ATPase family AAA domain-containing protein 3A/B